MTGDKSPVGIVSGESRSDSFLVTLNPSNMPSLYDYIFFELDEVPPGEEKAQKVRVIAQLRSIKRIALGIHPEQPWQLLRNIALPKDSDSVVAYAKILGYKWKGRIYFPRRAPPIGTPVYYATDSMLYELFSISEKRRLHIGYLITRPSVKAYLDLEGIKRHVAIIAATGAGKTWASVVLIEELLKKGATIIVLDPHGEYTAMQRTACRLGPEYCNSVKVVKTKKDHEGEIQYKISTTSMSAEELASVAGVPSKATRIRSLIAGAKELAEILAKLTRREEWLSLKGIIRILLSAIDAADKTRVSNQRYEYFAGELLKRLNMDKIILKEIEEAEKPRIERSILRIWLPLRKDVEPGYDALRYMEELRSLGVYGVKTIPITSLLSPATVTVINLSGLRTEVQDHVVYNVLSRLFNARLRHLRGLGGEVYPYPVLVVLEEAHRFIPPKSVRQTRTREIASIIASEGRKFGVYLTAITQRPSRIDPDILSQLQGQIVLRIVNPKDQDAIRDASEQISQDLLDNLPGLNTGEAVVVGPITPLPLMVRIRDRVLEYSGGDLSLEEEWLGGVNSLRMVEEMRREALAKINRILGVEHKELVEAISSLLGSDVDVEEVEAGLRLLAVDSNVWAGYDELSSTVYGEAGGQNVRLVLGEGIVKCSCGSNKTCRHAVAVLLRAVLDDLISRERLVEARPWWMEEFVH
ncbi:MAG: ATP-binding protein [Pyrodictiaceae archaeon]